MELELWIPATIVAAFFQNLRSALQKHLKGKLSTNGAAYARFLYALPVALLCLWVVTQFGSVTIPNINNEFLLYCLLGGVAQIVFTVLLLWMFSFKSFAVGTTFSKLEIVMIAILGAVVLGDSLNGYAIVAVALSAIGIVALSLGQSKISLTAMLSGLTEKATLIGLVCAAWLGGSVVFYRGAALALDNESSIMAAAYTLFISLIMQTLIMGVYLRLREPGQFSRVLINWRWASAVGVAGTLASMGWFTALALQNASYVRALGQIELVFTFAATTLVFRESVSKIEFFGIILVVVAILLILLVG